MIKYIVKILFIVGISFLFFSCKSSYSTSTQHKKTSKNSSTYDSKIVKEAEKYLGTPYKYAGTSKSGMDCSGLIYTVFSAFDVQIPRISYQQSEFSKKINVKDVVPGDLLFFGQRKNKVSHVGIVERVENDEVFFIHSSTSRGVIVSSLNNTYWNPRFIHAGRIDY